MKNKAVLGIMVTLLLASMVILAFDIQTVRASRTIYIRADGSVEGTDKIQWDGDIYTFTDNISDEIVVERNHTIIDGNGYTLQGIVADVSIIHPSIMRAGVTLPSVVSNVTIRNINIERFNYGIILSGTTNNVLSINHIKNNYYGIWLRQSSNNSVFGNDIMYNTKDGIRMHDSTNNTFSGNNITGSGTGLALWGSSYNCISVSNIADNHFGIYFSDSTNNSIFGNNIIDNKFGINLERSSDNKFFNNNFIDNTEQVNFNSLAACFWDDGYPSGGNYWSDYEKRYPDAEELGDLGIWDTPYVLPIGNQDNYPLLDLHVSPQLPYYQLLVDYTELKSKYDNLNARYHSLQAELNIMRNVMYAFLIIMITFILTTVYFAIRKPRVKPELKTT